MGKEITIVNKKIKPKPREGVYDEYWKYIAARQRIFWRKLENRPVKVVKNLFGEEKIWTNNKILQTYRFTQTYRAIDRVSQFCINKVIYNKEHNNEDLFFRINLFKIFNKIDTFQFLIKKFGRISWKDYKFRDYSNALIEMKKNDTIYNNAYMTSGASSLYKKYSLCGKHEMHLKSIELMMKRGIPEKIANSKSLEKAYLIMKGQNAMGPFIGFQHLVDLNYSPMINFSEDDFVVAGPGAKRGEEKCFKSFGEYTNLDIIKMMKDKQHEEFNRLGLQFNNLWGRDLSLLDIQNNFCEISKYLIALRPDIITANAAKKKERRIEQGRKEYEPRIKQKYKPCFKAIRYYLPPKWKLNDKINEYYETLK